MRSVSAALRLRYPGVRDQRSSADATAARSPASLPRVHHPAPAGADRRRPRRGDDGPGLPRGHRRRHRPPRRDRPQHLLRQLRLEGGLLPRHPGLRGRGGAAPGRRRRRRGRQLAGPRRRRARRLPQIRRQRARPGPHLHRRGALRRRRPRWPATRSRCRPSSRCFRIGRKVSPHGDELPETLEETIIGGIFWIIYQRIVLGETEQIEQLLPELVEFALTPYIGAEAARRATA